MLIDAEGLLNEKQANELKTSLTNMLKDFSRVLSSSLSVHKTRTELSIMFDNHKSLMLRVSRTGPDSYLSDMQLMDKYGELHSEMSLQDALNILKYTRNYENMIKSFYKIKSVNKTFPTHLTGCYTAQSLDKLIPIYNEMNPQDRILSNYKENIKSTPIKVVGIDNER